MDVRERVPYSVERAGRKVAEVLEEQTMFTGFTGALDVALGQYNKQSRQPLNPRFQIDSSGVTCSWQDGSLTRGIQVCPIYDYEIDADDIRRTVIGVSVEGTTWRINPMNEENGFRIFSRKEVFDRFGPNPQDEALQEALVRGFQRVSTWGELSLRVTTTSAR